MRQYTRGCSPTSSTRSSSSTRRRRIASIDPDTLLLIDHHEPADLVDRADASLVDTDAGATAELVARLAKSADWNIGPEAALPLLVGALADTDWLSDSGPQTASTVATLFEALDQKVAVLPTVLDRSTGCDERIASATSVLRSSGYRAGDLFVAFSRVGAHEGTAAERLREAGVDLAVVSSTQGDETRVTARASDRLAERVSLGATLLPALTEKFGGDGGGHAAVGSATVATAEVDAIVDAVLSTVESELEMTFSEVLG